MKNRNSSDTMAEDLIRVFQQLACSEGHLKTLWEKATAEMENGIIDVDDPDVLDKQLDKIDSIQEEINDVAQLRRETMLALYNLYEGGDKTYWCMVKHLATAAYTAFEVYQASDDDPELLDYSKRCNEQFVKALSHFLGVEVTTCAACFGDALKAQEEKQ